MKHVSIIGTLPPIKGISPYCADFALALAEEAHVDFIGYKNLYPERLYPGGTKCENAYPVDMNHPNLDIRNIISWYNPASWIRAGLSARAKTVIVQWWSYPLAPVAIAMLCTLKARGKRIAITVHNVFPHESNRLTRFLNASVFPFGDMLLVHTEKGKCDLMALGISESRIFVMQHVPFVSAYNSDRTNPQDRYASCIASGIDPSRKTICFFGNIREYKGLDHLLLALPAIKEKYPEILLIIAGQPWENWDKYDSIIVEHGLEESVFRRTSFLPFEELSLYLKSSHLVVFPFKELNSASGSLTLAQSLGCDVIATKSVELDSTDEAFLLESSDPSSIAKGIIEYFNDKKGASNKQIQKRKQMSLFSFSKDIMDILGE